MSEDDALNRAKRALAVVSTGGTARPVDKTKVDDLLTRAHAVTSAKLPAIVKERAMPDAAASPAAPEPTYSPPAVTTRQHQVAVAEPYPVELPGGNAPGAPTVIVNVTAPAYPYPYPYYPHPYWYPAAFACPLRNCPVRAGRPCNRWVMCPYL